MARNSRLEVPYEDPADAQSREDRELGIPWYVFGPARRAMRSALRERATAPAKIKEPTKSAPPATPPAAAPKTVKAPPPKMAPRPAVRAAVERKPTNTYVAPRDTTSYDYGVTNPSEFAPASFAPPAAVERGTVSSQGATQNYETMYPTETFNPAVEEVAPYVPGRVQFEDETQKPFWSRFKKGGAVKKKPAKKASGGSVKSSPSKRGDGCAQRGKTKGRMV